MASTSSKSQTWVSRYFGVVLVLVLGVLASVFLSSRNIQIALAESSTRKGKEPQQANKDRNETEKNLFHNATTTKEFLTDNNNDDDNDNEETLFYNTTWPRMQKVLCGEGAPNLVLSSLIFDLARSEVFQEDDPRIANQLERKKSYDGPSKTQIKFFAGEFGASVFVGTNQRGDPFVTVYAKIWKCANNQIRWMEKKLFKHINGTYHELQLSLTLGQLLPQLYKVNETITTTTTRGNLPPPCIYTAVRDPISHFLSGYNEVEVRQLGEYNNQSAKDWPSHAKPAPYHINVPYSSESPALRRKRFIAFVEDLLLEEPTFGDNYVYSHFFPVSRVLVILKKFNSKLTGYIPQLENITSTWPSFVSTTCTNFPSRDSIPTMKKQGQHKSSHDRLGLYSAAKDVWKQDGSISRSLCLLHAFDYACFEDLPDKIPPLCRKVYQDYAEHLVRVGTKNYFTYGKKKENQSD